MKHRPGAVSLLALMIVTLCAACGGARSSTLTQRQSAPTAVREAADVSIESAPVSVSLPTTCVEGQTPTDTAELCNAIDDNCDGEIDEGCAFLGGEMRVTVTWDTPGDIDLYLEEPDGTVLSFGNPTSSSGGLLIRDGRGGCNPESGTMEQVTYRQTPPSGRYELRLHYFAACTGGGPTTDHIATALIAIAVRDREIARYRVQIREGERVSVIGFRI